MINALNTFLAAISGIAMHDSATQSTVSLSAHAEPQVGGRGGKFKTSAQS